MARREPNQPNAARGLFCLRSAAARARFAGYLHVTLNKAVPLGLVCNEFTMNSIKHAFPNNKGRLTIRLEAIDATHGRLMIADDGIGFDHSTSFHC